MQANTMSSTQRINGDVEMPLSSSEKQQQPQQLDGQTKLERQHDLPQLAYSEINLGRVIGTGGFSTVSEIKSVDLDEIYDTDDRQHQLRNAFGQLVRNQQAFVLKKLRTDLSEREYNNGMEDLEIEAKFLSELSHPNIIQLKGISQSDPQRARFFVILDRLTVTLDRSFNRWRKIVGENTGYWVPGYGYCCSNSAVLHENWKLRLTAARDMGLALQFLHAQQIVYRDLKPDNVGFDTTGRLKLFDFGLAKRLDRLAVDAEGNYLLTGNTGSLRYMAPEVAQDKPYNTAVDVYSFAILFWQMCSLTTPYSGYSQAKHNLDVVFKGERPKCVASWPSEWKSLMERGWSQVPSERPTMNEIVITMERILSSDDHWPAEARIRAKIRKTAVVSPTLDVDTRTDAAATANATKGISKRHNANIV